MFAELLRGRFHRNADGVLAELAYNFTPRGHARAHQLYELICTPGAALGSHTVEALRAFAARMGDLRAKLLDVATELFPEYDHRGIGTELDNYLATSADFGGNAGTFWSFRRYQCSGSAEQICLVARVLIQLPASEAVAERMFSVFEYLMTNRS